MTEQVVTLRIRADAGQAETVVKSIQSTVTKAGGTVERLGDQGRAAMQRMEKQAQATAGGFGGVAGKAGQALKAVVAFAGITLGIGLVSQLGQMADRYRDINSRLELVTGSEQRYAAAQSQTYAIAQRTYTALDSTATLYGRMQRASDDLGRSQATAVRTTELIAKTYQISGTSAAAAAGSIMQLSQGLGAGALRGDEFNSVMEGAPRLAQALADNLGVTTGELRGMAEQGKLTADVIIDALERQGDVIDAEFERLKITNARAWQQVVNAATSSIGQLADRSGAIDLSAGLLQSLARGLEKLPAIVDVWGDSISEGFGQTMDMVGDDATSALGLLWGSTKDVLGNIADEFLILPVSMRTVVGVLIGEVHKFIIGAEREFDLIVNSADDAWIGVQAGVSSLVGKVKIAFAQMVDGVLSQLASLVSSSANLASKLGADDTAAELTGLAASLTTAANAEQAVRAEVEKGAKAYADERVALATRRKEIISTADAQMAAADDAIAASLGERDAALERVNATGKLIDADTTLGEARARGAAIDKEAAKAAKELADDRAKYANDTRLLAAELDGPLALAQEKHRQAMEALNKDYQLGRISLADYTEMSRLMGIQLNRTTADIAKQSDVLGAYLESVKQERALAGMTERQRSIAEAVQATTRDYLEHVKAGREMAYTLEEMQAKVAATTGELYDYKESLALAKDQAIETQEAWQEFGESLVDYFADGSDGVKRLWRDMLDYLKRQLIASGIQSLLQNLFNVNVNLTGGGGGGGFNLSSLLSMFGGGSEAPGAAGGSGGMSSLLSANSWVKYGQSLWQGFFGAGTTGASSVLAAGGGVTGETVAPWLGSSFTGGSGAIGVGSSGGASSAAAGASTAAYAAGAIAVAVIINGMFEKQGWHIENGFDNGAVNRLAMSGMPIVDVSALAQYGVRFADGFLQKLGLDKTWASMLSGSSITARLFGNQDPKIQRQGYEFEFGGEEATGNAYADWKAKGGLFSSSQWGTQEQALSAEMAGQIQTFWDSVRTAMSDAAATLGTDVPAMINASFKSTYDKDGKLLSEVGTILGRTYNEAFEVFQQRILAENIIATVGVSTPQTEVITGYQTTPRHRDRDTGQWVDAVTTPIMSVISEASAIAERWRGNAEELLAGAQFLLAAQTQMNQGNGLLGDDASLTQVADFIESVRVGNETLIDTYARVAAGIALVDQAFGLAGITTSQTREELVRWSTELVNNLGGIQSAAAYFDDFAKRYYTDSERTSYTLEQMTAAATTQFAAAELDLADFTGEGGNAAMRALVEGALASGNAELAAQYLRLAAALGMVSDAQAAYNAAIGEAAGPVAQTADQLATINEILDANAWELATAGMSAANLAIRDINKAFEDQRIQLLANAATTEQLTLLEDQRLQALQQQYDAFVAQFAPQADQSTLAGQTTTIRAWEDDQIAQAEAYAEAAGMEGVAASDLANIHAEASRRIAEAQATFQEAYDNFIATFAAPTIEPRNVAEAVDQTRAWEQRQIDRANELAIAAGMQGAAEEDLALIRARALDVIAAATAEFERQYQDYAAQFRGDTALPDGSNAGTLAEAQAQSAEWEQAHIARLNELAIAAGRTGAAEEDLANVHAMAAAAVRAAAERIAEALVAYNDFMDDIRRQNGEWSEFQGAVRDASRWYDDAVARATDLAHAAGLAGIAEGDLAAIELRSAQMRAEAYRVLEESARNVIAQLQGPASGSLEGINAQIAALESQTGSMGGAVEDLASRWLDALRGVRDFLDSMLLNTATTTLTPEQQLAEAQAQYEALLAAAQGGDANAAAQLPAMAQQYLDLARGFFSSGDQYQAIWDAVRAGLGDLTNMPVPGGSEPMQVGPSPALIALYEERDRLMAEQEAENRRQLAEQLRGYITDIIGETGESLSALAERLGINMTDFVEALGISLESVTSTTVQQLATLAGSMGTTVMDLADAVGLSLGDLADRQSLLNQAVQGTINGLPSESADALQPYFDAIADATNEADANAAIAELINQINLQPDDIRAQLAPYFEGIFPAESLDQLDYLSQVADNGTQALDYARQQVDQLLTLASAADMTNSLLNRIAENGQSANSSAGIPAFAAGGWVNGPTTLLAGEAGRELILPNAVSSFFQRTGIPVVAPSTGGDVAIVNELRALRREASEDRDDTQVALKAGVAATRKAGIATAAAMDRIARREAGTAARTKAQKR